MLSQKFPRTMWVHTSSVTPRALVLLFSSVENGGGVEHSKLFRMHRSAGHPKIFIRSTAQIVQKSRSNSGRKGARSKYLSTKCFHQPPHFIIYYYLTRGLFGRPIVKARLKLEVEGKLVQPILRCFEARLLTQCG
jgi:hypothetical protein